MLLFHNYKLGNDKNYIIEMLGNNIIIIIILSTCIFRYTWSKTTKVL